MQHKTSTISDYQKEVQLTVDYIRKHLDEKIDLEKITSLSHFSLFHFHRIAKAFLGESLGMFIIRMRVETAAKLLRYSNYSIQEIAYQVGYSTPSSLSKVFKQFYGISPNYYRNNKNFTIMKPLQIRHDLNLTQRLVELKDKKVLCVTLVGDYRNNDYCGAFQTLWNYAQEHNIDISKKEFIGVYYDDPTITSPAKQRADVCLGCDGEAKAQGEINVKVIGNGKYLAFLYEGPYTNLTYVYDTIYGKLFPESGYQLGSQPGFEMYLNDPVTTPPEKLLTEIYVPIK